MIFTLNKSLEILKNTPEVLTTMLRHISRDWTEAKEEENKWSVKDVIAHLIICEKTNWIVRAEIILSEASEKKFTPIDMTAHFELSQNNSLEKLLEEFFVIREKNIHTLKDYKLKETDFSKTAVHPKLGAVNLSQLLATWVAHDLSHMAQVSRIMAKQCKEQVGPFVEFLSIMNK